MYNVAICRVKIFLWNGGVGARIDLANSDISKSISSVLSGPARHALQAILYQVHFKILRLPSLFFTFQDFSWLRRFYGSRFMYQYAYEFC